MEGAVNREDRKDNAATYSNSQAHLRRWRRTLDAIATMNRKEWDEFLNVVKANDRPYASYFVWRSDRSIEEVGVVQSFHESLESGNESFFHSYSARGIGNDPPDCEALSNGGERIAIEVTELVDGKSIAAAKADAAVNWEPFTKAELSGLVVDRIAKKDNPSEVKGGPYQQRE